MIRALRLLARQAGARSAALVLVGAVSAVPGVAGPAVSPTQPAQPAQPARSSPAVPRIDANRATEAQLQTVKGIGPAIAARILEARRDGPFHDLADLEARVRGVGPANIQRFAQAGLVVGAPASGAARVTAGGLSAGASAAHAAPSPSSPPGPTTLVTPLGKGVIRESSVPPGAVAAGSATPNQGSRP
jgi:competence protein ComEA